MTYTQTKLVQTKVVVKPSEIYPSSAAVEAVLPGYRIVDFRPPKAGELFVGLLPYSSTVKIFTVAEVDENYFKTSNSPRYIVEAICSAAKFWE